MRRINSPKTRYSRQSDRANEMRRVQPTSNGEFLPTLLLDENSDNKSRLLSIDEKDKKDVANYAKLKKEEDEIVKLLHHTKENGTYKKVQKLELELEKIRSNI